MTILYKKYIVNKYILKIFKIYKIFNFDMLTKLNIFNFFLLFKLDKIISTVILSNVLKNEIDIKIVNALDVLDFVLTKKAEISKLNSVYIKKSKSLVFICRTFIQHWVESYLLLFVLKKILEPFLLRKFIFFKFKKYNNGFSLYVNDISSLDNLPDFLKKDKIGLKISFFFNRTSDFNNIEFFLRYFGFE